MEFYHQLETILTASTPKEKIALFEAFYANYKNGTMKYDKAFSPKPFQTPSYSGFCTVVAPKEVPKRSNLSTKEGQARLLHAVAHIEYSAIDLALDICYRFGGMPCEFYDDWLEVADDEVRHFLAIERILNTLGYAYGDFAVHDALFEASQKTAHSLLHRLAVVPRYLEANGLDATPAILKKLNNLQKNEILDNIKNVLELILEEEIDHVHKGDKWFSYVCQKEGVAKEAYVEIIKLYYPNGFGKLKELNTKARLKAGFSCEEMKRMVGKEVCKS